jgi:hypothetical protein
MKIAKKIIEFAGYALAIYIAIFGIWLMLSASCISYADQHGWQDNECGQDSLSQLVRKTHAPLIRLVFSKK